MNSPYVQCRTRLLCAFAAMTAVALIDCPISAAAPPKLLHTPGYESPVTGEPDGLLLLGGSGFHRTDRVVYAEAGTSRSSPRHPATVPNRSDANAGLASVVRPDDVNLGIVVRLPGIMRKDWPYRLWIVTASNEWSGPVMINDPRPQWFSPSYVYTTADFASLGRRLRIVGRNL